MRRSELLALIVLLSVASAAGAEAHEGWYADYDEAAEEAQRTGKDLLVDFTGSDWCGWCIRLKEEVFDHEVFATEIDKSFVLVALDFPNSEAARARVPNPERNGELQRKYGVQGFPTILLMTAEGTVYGQTGYREGGPESYLYHVAQLRDEGKGALALVQEFDAATGIARVDLIKRTIARLHALGSSSAVAPTLAPIAMEAVEARKGQPAYELRVDAITALFASGTTNEALQKLAREMDPGNELGVLERAVLARCGEVASVSDLGDAVAAIDGWAALGQVKEDDVAAMLYANAAWWLQKYLSKPEEARAYATKLQTLAGNDARFTPVLDEVLGADR